MARKLTFEQLAALNPCNLSGRKALFGRRKALTVKQALAAGATVHNILWVAGQLGHKTEIVEFTCRAASRVAHFDKSRKSAACIDVTRRYMRGAATIGELKNARFTAAAPADAAAAAAAYNVAADAADAATYAATYAADADAERTAQHSDLIELFS